MDYYKWFKDGYGNRDTIFKEVLSYFDNKPIKVLEIGTMRSLNERSSGGASTFFWAEYIKANGGELHICDSNMPALEFCHSALSEFYDKVKYYINTGVGMLNSANNAKMEWDIVYLDGGDNPREMVDEFPICHSKYILCDDFSTKGSMLRKIYPNYRLYKWKGHNHEMALYGADKEVIYLEAK